jgi:hypothetical protein
MTSDKALGPFDCLSVVGANQRVERRQQAVDNAQAKLDKAEQEHAKRVAAIRAEVEALENRSQAEDARWDKEKERLESVLRRARG